MYFLVYFIAHIISNAKASRKKINQEHFNLKIWAERFDFRRLTEKMQFQRCAIFFKRAFRIPCLSKLHNVVEWEIVHRFVAKWRLWLSSKANSNTYPLSPLSADCYGPIGSVLSRSYT